jgi:hypothetical protein
MKPMNEKSKPKGKIAKTGLRHVRVYPLPTYALPYDNPLSRWIHENFDERQQKEIQLARIYAERFAHGTDGHSAKMIIARLADILDKVDLAIAMLEFEIDPECEGDEEMDGLLERITEYLKGEFVLPSGEEQEE